MVAPTKLPAPVLLLFMAFSSIVDSMGGLQSYEHLKKFVQPDDGMDDDDESSGGNNNDDRSESGSNNGRDAAASLAQWITHLHSKQSEWNQSDNVADAVVFAMASVEMDQDARMSVMQD